MKTKTFQKVLKMSEYRYFVYSTWCECVDENTLIPIKGFHKKKDAIKFLYTECKNNWDAIGLTNLEKFIF